ncbi:LysR family transcriptional regulator [Modestobacter muralis]|uniref:LysR family transcriptional regulator n=1 Tax=Modestobacter muralis TaxID=1608614 RepID=A0A6P0H8H0_9ACTN|nr:LysR family transcriptional regulator [Modestobacter muralis]NEK95249.1 LysR family transcriptional regulator [Modestobacter muralis]NEN52137.1 LysR family transcriptional regulator [Modestobacter muralis]
MTGATLGELELLVAVAETGSLGLAARHLGISQPAASQRLRALESALGLALLDRHRTGSELTAHGALVVEWARSVLIARDRLTSGAEALRQGNSAPLRLAASLTTAEFLLPRWLVELRRSYPALGIGLAMGNSAATVQAVRRDEADLGFVETLGALPGELSWRTVASDRLALVVPPDHPWSRLDEPLSPAELARTSLVMRESGSGTRETLALVLETAGPLAPAALEASSTTAVKGAVLSGLAPAVLSALAVEAELARGSLVEVPLSGVDLRRPLRAIWRRGRPLTAPARRLLDLLAEGRPPDADLCEQR